MSEFEYGGLKQKRLLLPNGLNFVRVWRFFVKRGKMMNELSYKAGKMVEM